MAVGNWQHWPGGAAPPPPPSNEIPWTPRLILGDVTGWWASDDVTHAADTETVHKIFDRAQYGYDLLKLTQTGYREADQNGLGTVALGPSGFPQGTMSRETPMVIGKGDYLVTANVFRVYDEATQAERKEYMRLSRGGTTNPDYFRYAMDFAGSTGSSVGDFHVRWRNQDNVSASYSETIGNANIDFTRHQIHFSIIDLGAGTAVHRIDGTEVLNTTFVPTTPSNPGTDSSGIVFGGNQNVSLSNPNTGFFVRADFAEALWLNRMPTAGEIDLIEGYLAHKWGLQAHLPTAHPYSSSAPTILTPFLPSDVSGLAAWWDPTTLTSQAVGTEVTSLPDLGPRDLDLIPDTRQSSTGPILSTTNGPNNRRYLDYASKDTLWQNSPEEYFYNNVAGGTIFVVSRNDTLDGQLHYIYLIGTESGGPINSDQRAAFLKWTTGDPSFFGGRVPDNASAQWVTGPNPMSTSWALNCQRFDYLNTTAENFLNGALEFSTNSFQTSTRTTAEGSRYMLLGYRVNDGTSPHLWFEGGIAEVVVYDRTLSDDEREKIEGYLAHKYGLTLPAAHPYFSEPFGGSLLWDPSQLSSLQAWYDVSAETGYADGDTITSLTDQSGNGITVTGTGVYNTNVQNGLPVVTQSANFSSSTVPNFDGHTRAILMMVVKDASSSCLYVADSSATSRLILQDLGTAYRTLMTMSSGNTIAVASVDPVGFHLAASLADDYSGANSYAKPVTRINGTQYTGNSTGAHVGFLSVGHKVGLANSTAGQQVCEAVVVSDDVSYEWTDNEVEKLEGYLAHKWGLTGNLPANHPYKTSPPT